VTPGRTSSCSIKCSLRISLSGIIIPNLGFTNGDDDDTDAALDDPPAARDAATASAAHAVAVNAATTFVRHSDDDADDADDDVRPSRRRDNNPTLARASSSSFAPPMMCASTPIAIAITHQTNHTPRTPQMPLLEGHVVVDNRDRGYRSLARAVASGACSRGAF
jgi:hypothetical protein